MAEPSGMFKAGKILILIGAILQTIAAPVFLLMGLIMPAVFREAARQATDPAKADQLNAAAGLFGGMILFMAFVAIAGCVLGYIAFSRANRGNANGAFVFGLIATFLPPIGLLYLIGSILCKVSPEGSGPAPAQPAPQSWSPPK